MTTEQTKDQNIDQPTLPATGVRPVTRPEVQMTFDSSPSIDQIFGALAKAQALMKHPPKNRVAKFRTRSGDEYSYNYADLADTLDAITPHLNANGLVLCQFPSTIREGIRVVTVIGHESGQWISSTLFMSSDHSKPQNDGSAITYARRYAAQAMAGISSETDDDANLAQGNDAETGQRQRQKPADRPSELSEMARKTLAAFIPLQLGIEDLEAWVGKPMNRLDDEDFATLRQMYEDVKGEAISADQVRQNTAKARKAKNQGSSTKSKLEGAFGASKPSNVGA